MPSCRTWSPARPPRTRARSGIETIDFQGQPDIPADGDVIVAVAELLTRTQDLSDVIGRHGEGDEVVLTVARTASAAGCRSRSDGVRWKRRPAPDAGFRGDPGRVTAVVRTTDAADSRDVSLTIPARPDYLVLARLGALGGVD